MPFAGFKNFADCMGKVKAKSIEIKRKICGKLQAQHEKKLEIEKIKEEIAKFKLEVKLIRDELWEKTKWTKKK